MDFNGIYYLSKVESCEAINGMTYCIDIDMICRFEQTILIKIRV